MKAPRLLRSVGVLGAATVIGVGIGYGPALFSNEASQSKVPFQVDDQRSVASLKLPQVGRALTAAQIAERTRTAEVALSAGAPTADEAVARFLRAEQRGDEAAAWDSLSVKDRQQYPSVSSWRKLRVVALPPITNFTVNSGMKVPSSAPAVRNVAVTLQLRASLSEVAGLIPTNADAVVVAEQHANGWYVNFSASRITFRYLADTTLASAARVWVEGRSACKVVQQWRSSLYGDGAEARAKALCSTRTPAIDDTVQTLSGRSDTAALLAAFGPNVGLWARVVTVGGPNPFDLVLAPVGRQWLVIGVLPTTSRQGQG